MQQLERVSLDEPEDADEALAAGPRVDFEVLRGSDHHERLVALRREAADAHGERGLVVRELQTLERLQGDRVDHADAAGPFVGLGGDGRAAVVFVDVGHVVLLVEGLLLQLRVRVVVRLEEEQARLSRVDDQLTRRVGERDGRGGERLREVVDPDDVEVRARHADDALAAVLVAERRGEVERVADQRGERQRVVGAVAEPRLHGERQHAGIAASEDLEEPDGARSEEPRAARVAELPAHRIDLHAHEDAVLHADGEEKRLARQRPGAHPHGVQRQIGRHRVQRLHGELLQKTVRREAVHAAAAIAVAHREERGAQTVRRERGEVQADDLLAVVHALALHPLQSLVQLEVQHLSVRQRHHDLPQIHRRRGDRPAARRLPDLRVSVLEDLPEPARIDLQEAVSLEHAGGQRALVELEPRVHHLLHRLPHRQHDRRVVEADHHEAVLPRPRVAQRPQPARRVRQRVLRQQRDRQALLQHLQLRPRAPPAQREELRRAVAAQVLRVDLDQRRERGQRVHRAQVGQRARREDGDLDGAVGLQRAQEGGLGGVVVAQRDELVEAAAGEESQRKRVLVAHLRSGQQKALLGDVERRGRGNRVEILDHEVVHVRGIEAQRDFVQIPVFALHQVEQVPLPLTPSTFPHFALEQCRGDDHGSAVFGQELAARNGRADLGVVLVAVHHPVLRENQHAARAAVAGDAGQQIGGAFHGFAPLADHVVQTEVQLVVGEHLLGLLGGFSGGVLVGLAVVELQAGEHGIVVADI